MKYRPERVNKLIIEELNKILIRELEFPGALVTLTDVEVSKDLNQAMVKFSVFPASVADKVLKILNNNRFRLQFLLTRKINIKPMPKISFKIDYGLEKAARVEKALLNKDNIDEENRPATR